MNQDVEDRIRRTVDEWIEPGEKLRAFVLGQLGDSPFESILALTDKYLRIGSPTGGQNIALSEVRYIKWSKLWARLNIGTKSGRKRMVFSIIGRDWKQRAAELANAWDETSGDE